MKTSVKMANKLAMAEEIEPPGFSKQLAFPQKKYLLLYGKKAENCSVFSHVNDKDGENVTASFIRGYN